MLCKGFAEAVRTLGAAIEEKGYEFMMIIREYESLEYLVIPADGPEAGRILNEAKTGYVLLHVNKAEWFGLKKGAAAVQKELFDGDGHKENKQAGPESGGGAAEVDGGESGPETGGEGSNRELPRANDHDSEADNGTGSGHNSAGQ